MVDSTAITNDTALAVTAASITNAAALAATAASITNDVALAATAAGGAGQATPSTAQPSTDLGRGALLGRYVVLSKLGAGGMGVVYAGYDPELDRKVALKLLHPRLADDDPFVAREARARLAREAQALAKLNHPHIVAIHDVGEHERAVWLAMEYVEGETLSEWISRGRRTWRELLDVMTPAARGLSAAHEAGLVHRDIKPDNIMVGADGRVRVMDLGLARALDDAPAAPIVVVSTAACDLAALAAHVTRVGAVMGTPAYMSPEQFRGDAVDARTDVFSFCVTLWEALMGEPPFAGDTLVDLRASVLAGAVRPVPRDPHARRVPGWLRRVCLQGLATRPERRFPSMQALLAALSRSRTQARARKWLVGVAAVATLGASAALVQRHDHNQRVAACEAVGASIVDVWNDAARTRVREGILATGLAYAPVTADRVLPILDRQAEAWREHRTRACSMADLEGTLDAEQLDRAVWCLDERRMALAALVTELSHADAMVMRQAGTGAAGLRSVSPCIDPQVLAALPSPPPPDARAKADALRATLAQARTALWTGKYPEGLKQLRAALADVEALGWPPLTAAARQLEGDLLESTGAYAEAEAVSLMAYMAAAKLRAWGVAARAAITLTAIIGYRQSRHAEGKVWGAHAEVAVLFAGDALGLDEAHRVNTLGLVNFAAGSYAAAKSLHERALAIHEKTLGPEHPTVAISLNNIANVLYATGAYAEAKALYERVLTIKEKALGPEHPDLALSLYNLALVHEARGEYAEARPLYERTLVIFEATLGPEHPHVAAVLASLADVHRATGAHAEAKVLHERALAIREKVLGSEHPLVANSLNGLASVYLATGAYAEARTLYERALVIREKALGPEHPDVATSLDGLADVHLATGAYAETRVLYERILAIQEKTLGPEHANVAAVLGGLGAVALAQDMPAAALPYLERALTIYDVHEGVQERELAVRFNLARALVRAGGDRSRALAEARKAADGYREAGAGKAKELAEVEAFLADHGS
ncbi:MAG: serine/threonine protein kinase [Nannocystis sp.]|uniref:serine/threonine-protein kinase n=1 Tax=Nannocystis sp. TaxID=1962667 RepID=UPI0024275025|nr:serine/threonine-protein kinase [Nannocystis sp.]MBK9752030.1 serine/threonine protein kinase [Nannocystis sp.]